MAQNSGPNENPVPDMAYHMYENRVQVERHRFEQHLRRLARAGLTVRPRLPRDFFDRRFVPSPSPYDLPSLPLHTDPGLVHDPPPRQGQDQGQDQDQDPGSEIESSQEDGETFRQLRLRLTRYFRKYRTGRRSSTASSMKGVSKLWNRSVALLPKQAAYMRRRFGYKRLWEYKPDAPARLDNDSRKRIRESVDRYMQLLPRAGLTWKRMLGVGGMGAIALFEARGPGGGEPREVIVKMDLLGDVKSHEGLLEEKRFVHMYRRARHTVQPFDFKAFLGPDRPEGLIDFLESEGCGLIFLEYARYGDLDRSLKATALREVATPDVVLWRILRCLVNGLIAIEYPPLRTQQKLRPRPDNNRGLEEESGPLPEEIPPGLHGVTLRSQHVHFDLDPKNVLVCESDDHHPGELPIFKISDFGLMTKVDWATTTEKRWSYRRRGKKHILAPEQFAAQWDHYFDPVKEAPAQNEKVCAGDYSYKTNMWQVGMIMWVAMTHCYPPLPPIAEMVDIVVPTTGEIRRIASYGAALRVQVDDQGQPYWAHNGDPYWGGSLMDTVIWMLAHYPEDRPTLQDLEAVLRVAFEPHKHNPDLARAAEMEVSQWCQEGIHDLPGKSRPSQIYETPSQRSLGEPEYHFDPIKDLEGPRG